MSSSPATPRCVAYFDYNGGNIHRRGDCIGCGHVFQWDFFARGSFLCPNPFCRLPHICMYRRHGSYREERYVNVDDTTPLPPWIQCHNCSQTIQVPPIATASYALPSLGPLFPCPCCLLDFYYYRPNMLQPQPLQAIRIISPETGSPVLTAPPETGSPVLTAPPETTPVITAAQDDDLVPRIVPASGSFINSLPTFRLPSTCPICIDDFVKSSSSDGFATVSKLPCGHCFHNECVVVWLERSNTCPLCRHQFPAN